jgi:hypothetical protein
MSIDSLPLLQHSLESPSAFTPERLMNADVRAERGLVNEPVPPLCVLDFDGDLPDRLAADRATTTMTSSSCFHTSMGVMSLNGLRCGIVPRTIGAPYAVLVAEQLWAAGAQVIVGITSAGRVSPTLPLPSIVIIDEAVRDEGTSLHYVPPSTTIANADAGDLARRRRRWFAAGHRRRRRRADVRAARARLRSSRHCRGVCRLLGRSIE